LLFYTFYAHAYRIRTMLCGRKRARALHRFTGVKRQASVEGSAEIRERICKILDNANREIRLIMASVS
jgi:hypothetical protein